MNVYYDIKRCAQTYGSQGKSFWYQLWCWEDILENN